MPLNRYFVERSLQKIRPRLTPAQQGSLDTLIKQMGEDGRANFNALREVLTPLASSTKSANTMLNRFLERINETAAELGMTFAAQTTADKKAGENRWVWFEGLADAATKPYTGDLNSIPEALRMEAQRGLLLGQPIVLMTFNEHETRAVRSAFCATEHTPSETEANYTFSRLGIRGEQEIVHVISRQGRKFAQQTAAWAIGRFKPSALIATGIALGVRNGKRQIGDVLVSEYIFDYESARLNKGGSSIYRGARPPASGILVDRIRNLDHLRGNALDWPKVHIGCIACGDKLVDDPVFIEELKQPEPEFIGGEMESAGIEIAAQPSKTDWVTIKGISDWGDGHKNVASKDEDQRTAAQNAALVVKALLELGPLRPMQDSRPSPVPAQPPQSQQGRTTWAACPPPRASMMGLGDLGNLSDHPINGSANGRRTRLDDRTASEENIATTVNEEQGVPVLQYLRQWLDDRAAPLLFALLGEYGMGKTITCQLFAKHLDEAREKDPTQPIPLYFDLRHITGLREKVPSLNDALEECMSRGWLDNGAGDGYTLASVHQWVAQGAVIILDGLDEVLVKLTEADGKIFTENLLKLIADARARANAEGRALNLKVLITCRTQYFPTLQAQNSHFTQSDRGEFTAKHYEAIVLLPWSEEQVRSYLAQALPEMDIDRLIDMIRSIHNLEELTQRPYTLKLVAEFIPEIEQDRASARTIYGVTLYRKMAEKWLARDSGKHHIHPEHKLRLAAHLAAHLWRSGRTALPATELNDWFHAWIETDTSLRSRYVRLHPEQLEEDLRTATFLARQDEGKASSFRFAHTSLYEFFLASYLHNALLKHQSEAWALPIPSKETLDFLGQMLGEANDPALLSTLQDWSRSYQPQASELILAYALQARRAGWPTPILRQMDLRGAQLRSWVIAGERDKPLDLSHGRFDGADLRDAAFRNVILASTNFAKAQLGRSNFLDCSAGSANFQQTEVTATLFRHCKLETSQWKGAQGYRPQWICCSLPEDLLKDKAAQLTRPLFAPQTETSTAQLDWSGGFNGALHITFAPAADAQGRQWLASAGYDGTVRLWDTASGEAGPVLHGHEGVVMSCAFAPAADAQGRQWLASAGKDGTVRLWDTASGDCLRITALCLADASGVFGAGYATWEPKTNRIVAVSGDAWRYLAWMRPLPDGLPERIPLETFEPIPLLP